MYNNLHCSTSTVMSIIFSLGIARVNIISLLKEDDTSIDESAKLSGYIYGQKAFYYRVILRIINCSHYCSYLQIFNVGLHNH